MRHIPRTVVMLGVVSLLTDMSSELIYPLLPIFLTQVLGAGAITLGVIEGVAETTAAFLKVFSGVWTDRTARRKPFIVIGYGLAGLVRPLIGLATGWWFVLAMRFLDRVGKGIRTSPRDALIADAAPAAHRGAAFGFHRMMDHTGAVIGPLLGAALLTFLGFDLRSVFLIAAVPAVLVMVVLIAGVRETPRPCRARGAVPTEVEPRAANRVGKDLKRLLAALLVFTLGNSTDAFILLLLAQRGVPTAWVAVLWACHHVVKMGASYTGGVLSDRLGRKPMLFTGWAVYALVYLGFALSTSAPAVIAVFLVYGIYFGFVEPVERAWVADLAPKSLRGTALGLYHGVIGFAALPASLLFGVLWQTFGPQVAFGAGAALTLAASLLLTSVTDPSRAPRPGGASP